MALTLEKKKQVVEEVAEVAASSFSAIAAEYRGLSVAQMTELRVRARAANVYVRVVKNTLARRAVSGTEFDCMREHFVGPLVLGFSREDPGSAARLFKDFAKENDKFIVTAVSVGGQMFGAADLDRVAKLPTRPEALSLLMAALRAPVDKFARTVNEVPGKLVRTFAALREQREGQAG